MDVHGFEGCGPSRVPISGIARQKKRATSVGCPSGFGSTPVSAGYALVLMAAFAMHVAVLDFLGSGFADFGDFHVEVEFLAG